MPRPRDGDGHPACPSRRRCQRIGVVLTSLRSLACHTGFKAQATVRGESKEDGAWLDHGHSDQPGLSASRQHRRCGQGASGVPFIAQLFETSRANLKHGWFPLLSVAPRKILGCKMRCCRSTVEAQHRASATCCRRCIFRRCRKPLYQPTANLLSCIRNLIDGPVCQFCLRTRRWLTRGQDEVISHEQRKQIERI